MTAGELAAVAGGLVVAAAVWAFMFRLDRRDIWPGTWVAAGVVSAYAVGASAALVDAERITGPLTLNELVVGLAGGIGWLLATHIGARVIGHLMPRFLDQVVDLYSLAENDTAMRIIGPLVAMAVAEELLFGRLVQARAGIFVAVVVYGAVQIIEEKWALVLAAVLGGTVWGGLFAWQHGLFAPVVAHAVWTVTLTLFWPIRKPAASPADAPGWGCS